MRMILNISCPHEPFNQYVKDGSAGQKIQRILDEIKPEAVYFSEKNGRRHGILVVNLDDPSQVPALAEPFFLMFKADVEFSVAMTPEDLANAGLDELGKKWAQ